MFTPLFLRLFSRGLQLSIYDARHWQSVEDSAGDCFENQEGGLCHRRDSGHYRLVGS